jgi:hypothetical protein
MPSHARKAHPLTLLRIAYGLDLSDADGATP